MTKKIMNTEKAPYPMGPYSQGILANGFLFISGQLPIDPATGILITGNIQAETEQVMNNMKEILFAADMIMSNVIKCTLFLKDMNQFSLINGVYTTYFPEFGPARETVEVARLPRDASIQVSAIAMK